MRFVSTKPFSRLHALPGFNFSFATPYVFFTGKGGTGKTSLACATAVKMADAGKSVLIVSTDPASNLDEMFGCCPMKSCRRQKRSKMREELSGACTVEVAAFDEFAGLLGDDRPSGVDHVIFDAAPTGHTLRLLSLPRAWSQFLHANAVGASCLGPIPD
jgi:arsenite-transporting ATPase